MPKQSKNRSAQGQKSLCSNGKTTFFEKAMFPKEIEEMSKNVIGNDARLDPKVD